MSGVTKILSKPLQEPSGKSASKKHKPEQQVMSQDELIEQADQKKVNRKLMKRIIALEELVTKPHSITQLGASPTVTSAVEKKNGEQPSTSTEEEPGSDDDTIRVSRSEWERLKRVKTSDPPSDHSISSSNNNIKPTRAGLFGETNPVTTVPPMEKLADITSPTYLTWVETIGIYLSQNRFTKFIHLDPVESINEAIKMDMYRRPMDELLQQWVGLNNKLYHALIAATKTTLGVELMTEMQRLQAKTPMEGHELTIRGQYRIDELTDTVTQRYILDNVDRFIEGNSYLLWAKIKNRIVRSPWQIQDLLYKLLTMKYQYGTDPNIFKREFLKYSSQLESMNIHMPAEIYMAIWLQAIPSELSDRRRELGTTTDVTWVDIFSKLQLEYTLSLSKGVFKSTKETAMLINTTPDAKRKKCPHCNLSNHHKSKCWTKYPHLRPKPKTDGKPNPKKRDTKGEDDDDPKPKEFTALMSELNDGCYLDDDEEVCLQATEEQEDPKVVFIFDSGSTSHITSMKELLFNTKTVPSVGITSAIRGAVASITTRGMIQLNKQWKLAEVAYYPRAAANLISEGRLCDAGYKIYKDKHEIIVKDGNNKHIILRGKRMNKLWVIGLDDHLPAKDSITTLIRSEPGQTRKRPAVRIEVDEEDEKEPSRSSSPSNSSQDSSSSSSSSTSRNGRATDPVTGLSRNPRFKKKRTESSAAATD